MSYLEGLPAFAGYFGVGLGFVALFFALYLHTTPHREIALIRNGNLAASTALSGALAGFCLPLASAIAHSVSYIDLAVWGGVAFLAQMVAYVIVRVLLPNYGKRIESGEQSAAVLSATVHVGIGLLNAAAMVF